MECALRRAWPLLCALALIIVSLPISGAAANHQNRTLKLSPEKRNNPINGSHKVTATLSATPDEGPITIHFEIDGPGDPGTSGPGSGDEDSVNAPDGNTPESPDRTCVVAVGASECEVLYRNSVEGVDEIRGWIDHDETVEADMGEGWDESLEPGDVPEKDNTDVVKTKWYVDLPRGANLTCVPDDSSQPQQRKHTVTCTIQNDDGTRFAGWLIDAENLAGANDPDRNADFDGFADYDDICTTGEDGTCTADIPAEPRREAGTARVCFWVDMDDDASYHRTPKRDGAQCDDPEPGPREDQGSHDTTAFAEVMWFKTLHDSARLECAPNDASLPSSGPRRNHIVTCSLSEGDDPIRDVVIDAENLNGVNDPDGSAVAPPDYDNVCTTDASGTCEATIRIPDPSEDGSAEVCFWADENSDAGFDLTGERWDGGDCDADRVGTSDLVELIWERPQRSITLAASRPTVVAGVQFILNGNVTGPSNCVDGFEVDIRRAVDGTGAFEAVRTVMTDGSGNYSAALRSNVSASYRAVLTGNSDCAATMSDNARVEVRKKLALSSKSGAVRPGRTVVLRAKVLSCTEGVSDKVVLSKRLNGAFKKQSVARTNAKCVVVFSRKLNKRSVFRVHSPRDEDQLAGFSPRLLIKRK